MDPDHHRCTCILAPVQLGLPDVSSVGALHRLGCWRGLFLSLAGTLHRLGCLRGLFLPVAVLLCVINYFVNEYLVKYSFKVTLHAYDL